MDEKFATVEQYTTISQNQLDTQSLLNADNKYFNFNNRTSRTLSATCLNSVIAHCESTSACLNAYMMMTNFTMLLRSVTQATEPLHAMISENIRFMQNTSFSSLFLQRSLVCLLTINCICLIRDSVFSTRCVRIERIVALLMFVRPSVCLSVRPSVWDGHAL